MNTRRRLSGARREDSGASQIRSFLFWTGFALLLSHELDAVAQAEWRLLPFLNLLPDETAYIVFVTLHVPLMAVLMWLLAYPSSLVRRRSQIAIDAFLAVHAVLHWLLSGEMAYTFHSGFSNALIFGGGVVGLLHMLLVVRAKRNRR